MTSYNQVYQNYSAALTSGDKGFTTLTHFMYNGDSSAVQISSRESSIEACQAKCSALSNCGGATFNLNPSGNNCYFSNSTNTTGPSYGIIPAGGWLAVVKKSIYYAYQLADMNSKLIDLNKQIQASISTNPSENLDVANSNKSAEATKMLNDYNTLLTQRQSIKDLIQKYDTINESSQESVMIVNQNLLNYRVFVIVLIFLLYIGCVILFNIPLGFNPISIALVISLISYFLNMVLISFVILVMTMFYYVSQINM